MKLSTTLNHIRNSIRLTTITTMFIGVVIATAAGFAHSYAGLFGWGVAHKLTGWKADTFPLLVDSFILVGELGLFLIALDGLKVRKSWTSWLDILVPSSVIAAGWGASLWFNVNHLDGATRDDKITFAIPPIAAMIGLMILLRTVHRYAAQLEAVQSEPAAVPVVQPEAVPEPVPAQRYTLVRNTGWLTGTHARTVYPVPVRTEPPVQEDDWKLITDICDHEPTPVPAAVPAAELADEPAAPVAPTPEPVAVPVATAASNGHDARWTKGLTYCAEFHAVAGKLPGQRPLAAHLEMRNRQLAARILTHAQEAVNDGTIKHYLPEAAHPATVA